MRGDIISLATEEQEKKISSSLYIVKAFALVSIVLAHSSYTQIDNMFIRSLFARFASIGAIAFFIISGYYFNADKKTARAFIKGKITKLISHWICLGTLTFVIQYLRDNSLFSMLSFVNWIFGNGTYLWFLSVLLIINIIYFIIVKTFSGRAAKYINTVFMCLTICSIFFTAMGILPVKVDVSKIAFSTYNVYLNIFNWIGFFALGRILSQHDILKKNIDRVEDRLLIILLTSLCVTVISVGLEDHYTYWSYSSILVECYAIIAFFALSLKCSKLEMLKQIGKISMPIYILHIQLIGVLGRLFPSSAIFAAVSPCLCILVLYILLFSGSKISLLFKMSKPYHTITGMR
jgi:hypothetical protein